MSWYDPTLLEHFGKTALYGAVSYAAATGQSGLAGLFAPHPPAAAIVPPPPAPRGIDMSLDRIRADNRRNLAFAVGSGVVYFAFTGLEHLLK